jgi:hypothetical protein
MNTPKLSAHGMPDAIDYGLAPTLAPSHLLTSEQITFFREHGYLSIDAIMPPEEIPIIKAIYDRLFDPETSPAAMHDLGNADLGQKPALPQILQPAKYAPELLETQLVANIKAIMQQLLGPDAKMVGDHAINKPPHNQASTPWHQDEAYWDPAKDYSSVSLWIPLQPATTQNGCMHFVPGSHKLEVIPHRPIDDDPTKPGLEVEPETYDFSEAVACELPPGGATLHGGRMLHYTPPNNSDDYRRAYIAMGSATETPRETPRRFPWRERQAAARHDVPGLPKS